jgi:peptidoglycan hydrolase-like protein with peptidoglycan-binding domain
MPLSPFRARLALAAFLAVGGGVATNLLAFQNQPGPASLARAKGERARNALDSERLGRLALEATGGGEAPRRPATGAARKLPADEASPAQRIGSFAPSSGGLVRATLPAADPAEARKATVRAVQDELHRRGYEPGTADGAIGLVTRAAVLAYEHDQGLPLTADPSPEVLAHLRHGTSAPGAAVGLDGEPTPRAAHAEGVIRSVQQSLRALGYLAALADGQVSEDTVRAIREFEMDNGLVPSGRISAPLVQRLTRQMASRQKG